MPLCHCLPKSHQPPLYNLCMFLIDTGKTMSSVTDVLSGVPMGQNTPVGTTLAMIEQGMKEIDAVYKRIYRALKRELKMLYRINSIYLNEQGYADILDNPKGIARDDYTMDGDDIVPVGDPRVSTQMVKVMRAQAARDVVASTPGGNIQVATRRLLEAMDVNNVDELVPEGPGAAEMMQQVEYLQGMVEEFQRYIQSGQMQLQIDENMRQNQESGAKVQKDMAAATKIIAEAEAVEPGVQLGIYQAQLSQMSESFKQQLELQKLEQDQRDRAASQRVSGMGESSGNA